MKKVFNTIAFLALLVGFFMLAKPYGRFFLYEYESRSNIEEFNKAAQIFTTYDSDVVSDLCDQIEAYNQELNQQGQLDLVGEESTVPSCVQMLYEYFPSDTIGWLEIEKINVKMPIFYGINDENLSRGAAVMEGTSFPFGGENTNCVLAAHRLPGMLGEVEQLETGDIVTLKTFDNTLHYRIVKSIVISPYDKEKITIVPKRDMITLLTCHPYWVNSHRLIVYAERVPEEFEEYEYEDFGEQSQHHDTEAVQSAAEVGLNADNKRNNKPGKQSASDAEKEAQTSESPHMLLTEQELPEGEQFEPSVHTIRTEHIVRISGIVLTVVFLIRILIIFICDLKLSAEKKNALLRVK